MSEPCNEPKKPQVRAKQRGDGDILRLCRKGESEKALGLIKRKPEALSVRDHHNNGPLMCALYGKHLELANSLLAMGADPFEVTLEPDWPLALALRKRMTAFVSAVAGRHDIAPPLFAAVWLGNHSKVQSILKKGRSALEQFLPDDYCGMTPLSYAIICGDLEMVQLLIDNGANVDATKDKRRLYTPLMTALGGGVEFVELLLKAGADTAGVLAPVRRIDPKIVRLFKKYDRAGSPLISALLERNKKQVKSVLKDSPEQSNDRCPNGFPAIVLAVHMQDEQLIRDLVAAGANVDAQVNCPALPDFRDSALIDAAGKGLSSVVQVLLDLGANPALEEHAAIKGAAWQFGYGYRYVNKPDYEGTIKLLAKNGSPPCGLRHAVEAGSIERVKFLLSVGSDINEVDECGHTPLDYCTGRASGWGRNAQFHPHLAEFMISQGARSRADRQT